MRKSLKYAAFPLIAFVALSGFVGSRSTEIRETHLSFLTESLEERSIACMVEFKGRDASLYMMLPRANADFLDSREHELAISLAKMTVVLYLKSRNLPIEVEKFETRTIRGNITELTARLKGKANFERLWDWVRGKTEITVEQPNVES